jgi:superoxide dismutase, Fe-Mn family
MKRRDALKLLTLAILGTQIDLTLAMSSEPRNYKKLGFEKYPFVLPSLSFAYNGLSPKMSLETLETHHKTLHAGYVTNLNRLVANNPAMQNMDLAALVASINTQAESVRADLRWFGGGHLNHALFWRWLAPGGSELPMELLRLFANSYGNVGAFREEFIAKGVGIRGSGWVWIVLDGSKVKVTTTSGQDNPLINGERPIYGIDVFEHSYFLDHKAARRTYLETVWDSLTNWNAVFETWNSYLP